MYNVSNFRIAKEIIQTACKANNAPFIDLEVEFDKDNLIAFKDSKLFIGKPETLTQTLYNIVLMYLTNFENFYKQSAFKDEQQKQITMTAIATYLVALGNMSDTLPEARIVDPICQKMFQYPLIWILMKDLICPVYDITVNNVKIVCGSSPFIDTAVYDEAGEFIFLNSDIAYEPCQLSCLLLAVIEAHELDCRMVIEDILSSELRNKLEGALKLEFKNPEKVEDFLTMLKTHSKVENNVEKTITDVGSRNTKTASVEKVAQSAPQFSPTGGSWWYLGLIEKMLEPVRGNDYTAYNLLEPMRKELWDKIEKARRKVGRDGLSYEALLRVQVGKENPTENVKTIEKMLSNNRIY